MEQKEICLCRRCGRKLKTDEARERGYGKVCWEKSRTSVEKRPLFQTKENTTSDGDGKRDIER